MEFKGTKGPWSSRFNGTYFDVDVNQERNKERLLSVSVMLYDKNFKPLTKTDENRANALLISKAPEMLGMLKEILASEHLRGTITESKVIKLINSATTI